MNYSKSSKSSGSQKSKKTIVKRNGLNNRFFSPNVKTSVNVPDIGGFPDEYNCHLRYSVSGTLAGAGTSLSTFNSYYINGPGSLSHTPKGWDVLKEPYESYLVTGFSARVTVTNLSTTIPVKVFVVPVNAGYAGTLSTSSINDIGETDGCYTRQLGVQTGGHDVGILDYPFTKISALAGLDHDVSTENDDFYQYTGSANASSSYALPTNAYQLVIACYSLNGSNIASNSLSITVELDMRVKFFDKLPLY